MTRRKLKWTDLFGMDPDYVKDAETDERTVRRQVAEEIATALEAYVTNYPEDIFPPDDTSTDCIAAKAMRHAYPNAARIARDIGAGETSCAG